MSSFKELWIMGNEIRELDTLLDNEEIDVEEHEEAKEYILSVIQDDIDGLVNYDATLMSKIEECKAHKKRINEYQKFLERKEARLKKFLLDTMKTMDISKLEGSMGQVKKTTSKYVDPYKPSDIPKEYIKEKIEYTIDKAAIKKAIKSGIEVPGAQIAERNNVTIK